MISRTKAEAYLRWAEGLNPGPWVSHSKAVAHSASVIAEHSGLDSERAYTLGLLHDIGRYKGVSAMMHIYDGYRLLKDDGYEQAAQICITHSFPSQVFEEYSGQNDCAKEIEAEIRAILKNAVYTDYDRLIQLCDSLALPSGLCLMEKRLVDVALRHGANDRMLDKWKKLFEIFNDFQKRMGKNLYSFFPDVVQNTFS